MATTKIEEQHPNIAQENILTNGDFEVWQRGAGSFSVNRVFTADEWELYLGTGGACAISRSTTKVLGNYSAQAVVSTVSTDPSNPVQLRQGIELGGQYEGLWLTFSCWVKVGVNEAAKLMLYDYNGATADTATSDYHTGSGDWELLTVYKEIRTGLSGTSSYPHSTALVAAIAFDDTTTIQVDAAMMAVGRIPGGVRFIPLHPADESERCLRYYESHTGTWLRGFYADTDDSDMIDNAYFYEYLNFAVRKSAVPTITTSSVSYPNTPRGGGLSVYGAIEGFIWRMTDSPSTDDKAYLQVYFNWAAEVA